MRQAVAKYAAGQTFACVKMRNVNIDGSGGTVCGAEIRIHGFHWCAQVCPVCLANYFTGHGTDYGLYLDTAGFYPADIAARVRQNIVDNGGQYVPTF